MYSTISYDILFFFCCQQLVERFVPSRLEAATWWQSRALVVTCRKLYPPHPPIQALPSTPTTIQALTFTLTTIQALPSIPTNTSFTSHTHPRNTSFTLHTHQYKLYPQHPPIQALPFTPTNTSFTTHTHQYKLYPQYHQYKLYPSHPPIQALPYTPTKTRFTLHTHQYKFYSPHPPIQALLATPTNTSLIEVLQSGSKTIFWKLNINA